MRWRTTTVMLSAWLLLHPAALTADPAPQEAGVGGAVAVGGQQPTGAVDGGGDQLRRDRAGQAVGGRGELGEERTGSRHGVERHCRGEDGARAAPQLCLCPGPTGGGRG